MGAWSRRPLSPPDELLVEGPPVRIVARRDHGEHEEGRPEPAVADFADPRGPVDPGAGLVVPGIKPGVSHPCERGIEAGDAGGLEADAGSASPPSTMPAERLCPSGSLGNSGGRDWPGASTATTSESALTSMPARMVFFMGASCSRMDSVFLRPCNLAYRSCGCRL